MTLDHYAQLITREVRARLPDLRAVRRGTTITWTRGQHVATLDAAHPKLWWLVIGSDAPSAPARMYYERHDAQTARVAANNIVVHFEPHWSRGIDAAPYTDAEMALFGMGQAAAPSTR